ncbi:hypothetical protein DXG03_002976 [Asterophora parasitica]|uniref:Uncharacterized protein n=1 Tax=Asterophora parasitica TaxID=117018 RepID=A0A9P7G7Y9_9AGAR|nr:hypothetical protein DXG03_002976 [Asterophora parasitica]
MSLLWIVVESGAIYTSAAIVQLVTYLEKMNAGVILELIMAQLSAIVPALIIVRVGLGFAYDGNETVAPADDVVLSTLHDTMPVSILSQTVSFDETLASDTHGHKTLSDGSKSPFRTSSSDPHYLRDAV